MISQGCKWSSFRTILFSKAFLKQKKNVILQNISALFLQLMKWPFLLTVGPTHQAFFHHLKYQLQQLHCNTKKFRWHLNMPTTPGSNLCWQLHTRIKEVTPLPSWEVVVVVEVPSTLARPAACSEAGEKARLCSLAVLSIVWIEKKRLLDRSPAILTFCSYSEQKGSDGLVRYIKI